MDTSLNYQNIICDILTEYHTTRKYLNKNIQSQLILDPKNHQYLLMSVGWDNAQYTYLVSFHIAIIHNKVWIQQNNTDVMIADELMEKGIPAADIVLGFVKPSARSFTGFATV